MKRVPVHPAPLQRRSSLLPAAAGRGRGPGRGAGPRSSSHLLRRGPPPPAAGGEGEEEEAGELRWAGEAPPGPSGGGEAGPAPAEEEAAVEAAAEAVVAEAPVAAEEAGAEEYDEAAEMRASLKEIILDEVEDTKRGTVMTAEKRADIAELIVQLEAYNPEPSTSMAGELLAGKWKLVYTSNSELYPLLLADELPFVTIGDITQTISADSMEVTNRLAVEVPFLKFGVRAGAALQLRSAKTLDVKFNKTTIETPSVVPSFDLPDAIDVLGQSVDLSPLAPLAGQLQDALKGTARRVNKDLGRLDDLEIPVDWGEKGPGATWLLTTYLDDELRISRGDGGGVFILKKLLTFVQREEPEE